MVRFVKYTADGSPIYEFVGLSTESKPDAPEGSSFYEMDTNKKCYASKHGWIDQTAKRPVSIALSGLSETQYEGVAVSGTPTVTATYSDNSSADVTENAVIVAPTVLAAGANDITAEYTENGIRVTLKVTVTATAKALASIAVTTAPDKTEYAAGETFDPSGAEVTATYNNGQTADVTESVTWTPTAALTAEDTAATAEYSEGGVTKTDTVSITVTAADAAEGGE